MVILLLTKTFWLAGFALLSGLNQKIYRLCHTRMVIHMGRRCVQIMSQLDFVLLKIWRLCWFWQHRLKCNYSIQHPGAAPVFNWISLETDSLRGVMAYWIKARQNRLMPRGRDIDIILSNTDLRLCALVEVQQLWHQSSFVEMGSGFRQVYGDVPCHSPLDRLRCMRDMVKIMNPISKVSRSKQPFRTRLPQGFMGNAKAFEQLFLPIGDEREPLQQIFSAVAAEHVDVPVPDEPFIVGQGKVAWEQQSVS